MAKNPREYVGDALDVLRDGLGPYVLRVYKMRYGGKDYLREMELALHTQAYSAHLPDDAAALEKIDIYGWLNLMIRRWDDCFFKRLGHPGRNWVGELLTARNDWAHQKKKFSNEEARRVCDTAKLLLQTINASAEANAVGEFYNELARVLYERQAQQSQRQAPRATDAPRTTDATLRPWRDVIVPHQDVRSGRFMQAEFAADLSAVISGMAAPEYQEAGEFFNRTYMTEGLRDLLANGIKRLTGVGGDPVVQLQTNFGGGKTHSMLALYHAFGDDFQLSSLREFDEIQKLVGDLDDDLRARRAVIVGTNFNVSQPRQHENCTTRTIWGEIAWQLGGLAGYELVEQNDLEGTNPGSETLAKLMEKHGPALIILDELVRLTQNVYQVEPAPAAGSFEAILAFMQSLTEAVKITRNALLLVSIPASESATKPASELAANPASEIEIGGEGGYATLQKLRQTLGRIGAIWKPVSAEESYEIVRRRLFSEVSDYPARDAVVNAFVSMYADSESDFPPGVTEGDYRRKIRSAYPIHPEFFERLYEDWSTLERFQRTRGVLRMMASIIHRLWIEGDTSLMIMPGSVPMWNKTVESEVANYLLPRNYSPVIAADIDGTGSKPFQIDQDVKQLGRHSASRRVARAIFIGSSPTKQMRGIDERRVYLATVQPGERASVFGDALRRMSNQLTYLYNDGIRYWYDTRATVNRTAEDRAQNMDPYKVREEAGRRLRDQPWDRNDLGNVHFLPENSAEIPDEQSARVVVLGPEYSHRSKNDDSEALQFIRDIMKNRGNSPRHHRNMLVFIAPDETRNAEWQDSIRKYLAWQSIENDAATLNLDHQQSKQVEQNLKRENETVNRKLQETYTWLVVPQQPKARDEVRFDPQRIRVSENFLAGAARKLKSDEDLLQQISPGYLLQELAEKDIDIWKDAPHLSLKKLWEWLTNYCYLPRLADRNVLEATIKAGLEDMFPPFAYATGIDSAGKYEGLRLKGKIKVYFDQHDMIVEPKTARAQIEAERAAIEPVIKPPPDDETSPVLARVDDSDDPPPPPKPKTRYHGSVAIDPQRPLRDLSQIAEEIITRLAQLPGADVSVTVEIAAAHRQGFDDATIRTISENSGTLKFDSHGFED